MINRLTRNKIKRFRKKFFCEIWGEFIAKKKLNRTVTRYLQAFDYNYRLYCNAKLELYLKNFYKRGKTLRKSFKLKHNKLALNKTGCPLHRRADRKELFWENFYSYYNSKLYGQYTYLSYEQGFLQSLMLRR